MMLQHSAVSTSSYSLAAAACHLNEAIAALLAHAKGLKCLYQGEEKGVDPSVEKEKWRKVRETRVDLNGSSMPAICGHNYFESPDQCALKRAIRGTRFYNDKLMEEVFAKNIHISRGVQLEPIAKRKFAEISESTFLDIPGVAIFVNENVFDGLLGGTPDGITTNFKLVEIKCPKKITVGAKRTYNDQIQSYLHLFNIDECYLFQYVSDTEHLVQSILRDESWLKENQKNVDHYIEMTSFLKVAYRKSLFATVPSSLDRK